MKKIYLYTSLILLLAAGGCKKELTQNPYDGVPTDQAFNTPADFTNAIRGAYVALRGASYYGGQDNGAMVSTPDVLSDNLVLNQAGRKSQLKFYVYNYVGNDTWELWGNAYNAISRVNLLLQNLSKLPDGEFKDNVHGEALAIRALAHFDLLRVYAKSYTSANDNDLGVPFVTSVDPTLLPARTPLKQAYSLVVTDFEDAIELLAQDNDVGRIHKAAAEGLLSRVYLYMGEWQKSADAATAAIADVPAANDLASPDEFDDIWVDATEKDVLFKIKNLDADITPVGVGYKQSTSQGVIPEYSVDFAFYQLFTDNDVRKNAYIGETEYNGIDYLYVKKYSGKRTGDADVVDIKVIRMGEVYLNRAEAYYNLNNEAGALEDLNTLRSSRYTGFVDGAETGTALGEAIQQQRRLELAFEGSRFFDLKRLNKAIERSDFGDRADGSGIPASVKTLPANDLYFLLPIPQAEINVNPNMKQNPY
ncbi:RagB/SusD family nutrient uptake outer membrane protein [Mucilaginibacter hurinus]|uniref:RagB/SusD family nutrient uptake outer membrane protein n=1 Tax=Mucilaginibacter hurinus TaxID=2201324 RepID=A0A367GN93_9SPHI|nr:RagB/SusD family nutrient uptake outer membrane protein [Mucilaginibacter hurinus]RCH54962.1 RagB/SusD family nutrient uptake outer membrane protein [Mucilaginibacter hurinus]